MVDQVNIGAVTLSKEYTDTDIAEVAANTSAYQSLTAAGVKSGRGYLVAFSNNLNAGLGFSSFAIADADDSLEVLFQNSTASNIDPAATGITMHVVGI